MYIHISTHVEKQKENDNSKSIMLYVFLNRNEPWNDNNILLKRE